MKGTVGLGGRKARSEQFIMDEDGTLLRDKVRIRKRWGEFFQTLLNKTSAKLDLTTTVLFPQRPLAPSLGESSHGMDAAKLSELLTWGAPYLIRNMTTNKFVRATRPTLLFATSSPNAVALEKIS